jgi:hypothetical protein
VTADDGGVATGADIKDVSVTVAQAKFVQVTGPRETVDAAVALLNRLPVSFREAVVRTSVEVETHERDAGMVQVRRKRDADAARLFPIVTMMKDNAALLASKLDQIMSQELEDVELTCSNCNEKVKLSTAKFCEENERVIPGNFLGMAYKERQGQQPAVLHIICMDEKCACLKWWEAETRRETSARADDE